MQTEGLTCQKTGFNPSFSSENACTKSRIWQLLVNYSIFWLVELPLSYLSVFMDFPFCKYTFEVRDICYYFYLVNTIIHKFVVYEWQIYVRICCHCRQHCKILSSLDEAGKYMLAWWACKKKIIKNNIYCKIRLLKNCVIFFSNVKPMQRWR